MKTLKVKRLSPNAILPKRVTSGSAGLDLYCSKKIAISTESTSLVETGWAVEIPEGYFGLIKIKSGFATHFNVTENAGVIDSDYRGELKVAIANVSSSPLKIERGESFAQLLILPCEFMVCEEVETLSETKRGVKGFGQASKD